MSYQDFKDNIKIPIAPLISIDSVYYYLTDNSQQTLAPGTNYFADLISEPGRICLPYQVPWPLTILRPENGVLINFTAGYSPITSCPFLGTLKAAMLLIIGHLYEHREWVTSGSTLTDVPHSVTICSLRTGASVTDALAGVKAADFHHRVTLQQNTLAQNSIGEQVNTWVDYVTLWAALDTLSGHRFWEAKMAQAEVDGIIHIRYYPGITANMRVLFGTRTFKIQQIINVDERDRELLIYYKEIQL